MARAQEPATIAPARVIAVRVHGNHTTPDAQVLALGGIAAGDPVTPDLLAEVQRRIEASGRFRSVEVRQRYASLDDPSQVLLVIVVEERAGIRIDVPEPGVMRRVAASTMWLPVLRRDDGYGFTYGARVAFVDLLGPRTRVSVPLTWGGERRAAVELERTFARGVLTRVLGTAGVWRREHPTAGIGERRVELALRAERTVTPWLRAGGGVRRTDIWFAAPGETASAAGVDLVVDTSRDPAFPRNAVYAAFGLERLWFGGARATARASMGVRGYVGAGGRRVLALRVEHVRAADPLPLYEQALLGGTATLRGFRLGYRTGDRLAAASVELRLPVTSPVRLGRAGFTLFADTGTVYAAHQSLRDARFDTGVGSGMFLQLPVLTFRLDVARGLGSGTRAHVSLGVTF